jgi:hypothetical protein
MLAYSLRMSLLGSLDQLVDDAYFALGPVAEMDGRVLYSSIETLGPGKFYLMGLNPGARDHSRYHHVGQSLHDITNHRVNTYLDDNWGRGIGRDHVQQRICFMLRSLGCDPRSVFATNLVFARSKSWASAQAKLIPNCLEVHGMFLNIVRPSVILTFGRGTFDPLINRRRRTDVPSFDTGCPNGRANFCCYMADADLFGRRTPVVCLPHFSKFKIDAQPSTVRSLREAAITFCDSGPARS